MTGRPSPDFAANRVLAESGFQHSRGGGVELMPQPSMPEYLTLGNPDLPIYPYRRIIVDTIEANPLTIIMAETGAGKTTQVPQFLLDAGHTVSITQPRRAAARNDYIRTYDEIRSVYGQEVAEDSVSYKTAGEREGSENAVINIYTDGLQKAREFHGNGHKKKREVSILDEVHEWNKNLEMLVAWGKLDPIANPDRRLVIMSATIDGQDLARYFSDVSDKPIPILVIPGRSYETEKFEKPESSVVEEVTSIVKGIVNEDGTIPEGPNDILVFVPGKQEISDTLRNIRRGLPDNAMDNIRLYPLHSKTPKSRQQEAMEHYPGNIKIVVATNIAETSLTILGVKHVVDSGHKRNMLIDEEGAGGLRLEAVSQADCMQRAGRTGRVCSGTYVLTKLNNKTPHTSLDKRNKFPVPEILRTELSRDTLTLGTIGIDIAQFDLYHKPSKDVIDLAKAKLVALGAFDDAGRITQTGYDMDRYPVCTSSARIMAEAERYKESVRSYLSAIVASKEAGGLQDYSDSANKHWKELSNEASSDLLVQLDIFIAAQKMTKQELIDNDVDINNFLRAQEHYVKVAKLAKAPFGELEPPTEGEREDIKRCIYMGFLDSIYRHEGDGLYAHAAKPNYVKRVISNRSSLVGYPPLIVGDPYNIELAKGELRTIQNVTTLDPITLGGLTVAQSVWRPDEYINRGGKYVERTKQLLFGVVDIGIVREVAAVASPRLRAEIIQHALDNPGSFQKELRAIKKEVEGFAHRAKSPIKVFTQDDLMNLIHRAAPDDITTSAGIEDGLRAIVLAENISIDTYISREERELIIQNSPDEIVVDGTRLLVKYVSRKPLVDSNMAQALALPGDSVYLEDGREVLFVYRNPGGKSKKVSLKHLKSLLRG
ncbi:MAG: helicase-related protein [Candidatus Saccharimonadales bacterium]